MKIIWAIDPFEETLKSQPQLLTVLKHLSHDQNAAIEPVHVLNLAHEIVGEARVALTQLGPYQEATEKAAQDALKNIHTVQLLPPRILVIEDSTSTAQVKALIKYSNEVNALCIVVGTHARHGLSRLFLGSFTETLLLHSDIPVVTVGPECQSHDHKKHVLFATDFESHADQAFYRVLNFTRKLNSEMTLFHVVPHSIEPVLQSGSYLLSGGWITPPEYITENEDKRRKTAESWAKEANKLGVSLKIHFESARGSISELILDYAKKQKIGWIAMTSESGTVTAALMGSITRQVVRQSPCPVWVIRTHEEMRSVSPQWASA